VGKYFRRNTLVADHGTWQEWDISTKAHPSVTMKIDTSDMLKFRAVYKSRIYAFNSRGIMYARFAHKGRTKFMHEQIIATTLEVDHVNHDGTDNRKSNLREATHLENARNHKLYARNKSGVNGVHWHKGAHKWQAYVTHNKKQVHLGLFTSLHAAIAARRAAEVEYYGEFRCKV
jgi:hypothetical protein